MVLRWRVAQVCWALLIVATVGVGLAGLVRGWNHPHLLAGESLSETAATLGLGVYPTIVIGLVIPAVVYTAVAVFVVWRRPRDVMALVFGVTILTNGAVLSRTTQVAYVLVPSTQLLALAIWLIAPTAAAFFLITFPDGRIRQRWSLAAPMLAVIAFVAYPRSVEAILYLPSLPAETGRFWTAVGLASGAYLLGALVQIRRYRHGATSRERQQIKWAIFPLLALLAWVFVVGLLVIAVDHRSAFGAMLLGVIVLTLALPIAWSKAILRHGLYEIDRIISRTASYALIGGALAAVYAGSVVGLQALLPVAGSEIAVAGSTLAAAAAFQPVRLGVQRAVDRRFNRAGYEADRVVEQFTHRLRQEVDLEAVATGLQATVSRTMQPESVGLWLAPRDMAGSTAPDSV
jgi:hypothetical protein